MTCNFTWMLMTDVPTYGKNLADIVAIYGRGRELFRPPSYGVYIGKSVSGDKFWVAWCQPIGLMQVVWWYGKCSSQCSFEARTFIWKEILPFACSPISHVVLQPYTISPLFLLWMCFFLSLFFYYLSISTPYCPLLFFPAI